MSAPCVVMLSVDLLSIMSYNVTLSEVMLNVVMLGAVAPSSLPITYITLVHFKLVPGLFVNVSFHQPTKKISHWVMS
jgi:hypothetical protein